MFSSIQMTCYIYRRPIHGSLPVLSSLGFKRGPTHASDPLFSHRLQWNYEKSWKSIVVTGSVVIDRITNLSSARTVASLHFVKFLDRVELCRKTLSN